MPQTVDADLTVYQPIGDDVAPYEAIADSEMMVVTLPSEQSNQGECN